MDAVSVHLGNSNKFDCNFLMHVKGNSGIMYNWNQDVRVGKDLGVWMTSAFTEDHGSLIGPNSNRLDIRQKNSELLFSVHWGDPVLGNTDADFIYMGNF